MKGHLSNTTALAAYLSKHPQVEKVYYPGLPSHEGHQVAAGQMNGYGSMLSFCVKGDAQTAEKVISKLKLYTNATSLGGVESLIERRAAVEGPDTLTPQNLIRVSVGLEHIDDLIADID